MTKTLSPRIIVAIDFDDAVSAHRFLEKLDPTLCRLKIGSALFTRCGPSIVEAFVKKGFDIFLDLKFHDIPNTVSQAIKAACDGGVWMVNVHVSGGEAMLKAAVETIHKSHHKPLLIGVTVLTSLVQHDLKTLGIQENMSEHVLRMAHLAQRTGLSGVVCSAQEASLLRQTFGQDFILVTPGIRLATDAKDDQQRVVTPEAAFAAGSDYLVLGRSITHAKDPLSVLQSIAVYRPLR